MKRPKSPPQKFFHKCASCDRQILVEFKRCRRCSGLKPRADVDALKRRLPGSYGG